MACIMNWIFHGYFFNGLLNCFISFVKYGFLNLEINILEDEKNSLPCFVEDNCNKFTFGSSYLIGICEVR